MRDVGLASFADRPANKLSGGMKQKLGLCCALIHDPELLILDEPTTGVDPLSRRQFWELVDRMRLRAAKADGAGKAMSVIVATAYMEEAERFDFLIVLNAGKILATGSPAEIKARTGAASIEDAYIALLPEEERSQARKLVIPPRGKDGDGPVISARGLTCRFGDFTAVDHVDLDIERGEIFGFLGSNGCGKTTTMKMLTGLLPASEGTRAAVRPDAWRLAAWSRAAASATCRRASRSIPNSPSRRISTCTPACSSCRATRRGRASPS